MSFIDLMGTTVWTEFDITNRTEAMVHSIVPASEELILNRKILGASMGMWTLTAEEQALLQTYTQACLEAKEAGVQARADMIRLQAVLDYEAALRRLAMPVYDGPATITTVDDEGVSSDVPNPLYNIDDEERAAAQATVDAATEDTLALYALRHPAPVEP